MKTILVTASAIVFFAGAAFAQDSNLRFGVGVSTLGGTLEGAYRFNDNWAVRGVLSGGLNGNKTDTADGAEYDFTGRLGGLALLGDYYTGSSGFRVSGGAFVSNTSISGVAKPVAGSPIDIGLTTLGFDNTVNLDINFARKVSPMVTVGYDWNVGKRFTVSGEIGAIAMGGLKSSISTAIPTNAADIAREENNINSELDKKVGNIYPYIAITGSFRF